MCTSFINRSKYKRLDLNVKMFGSNLVVFHIFVIILVVYWPNILFRELKTACRIIYLYKDSIWKQSYRCQLRLVPFLLDKFLIFFDFLSNILMLFVNLLVNIIIISVYSLFYYIHVSIYAVVLFSNSIKIIWNAVYFVNVNNELY